MSKISTVYDEILEVVPSLFPTKIRIPNGDSLIDNPHNFLRNGWAIRLDNQSYETSEFHIIETSRIFTIIFTKEVIKTDSQVDQIDEARKNLLEDVLIIQKDFFNIDRLGIPDGLARVELNGTSGILDLKSGKSNFIYVEVYFNIHIREIL